MFVVEQTCVYPDLDNKDIDVGSLHIMMYDDDHDSVVGYARCLAPAISFANASSIGRVVIASSYRNKGHARKLMSSAIQTCFDSWPEIPIEIGAQTYLQKFYEGLGFIAISSPYDEDGIMHVNMRLTCVAWLKA